MPCFSNLCNKPQCQTRSKALDDFSNRWCKQENVEPDALKEWKINIFFLKLLILVFHFTLVIHIIRNTPPKPKSSFRLFNEVSRIFI